MQTVAQKSFAQRASTARASGRTARSSRAVTVCASVEHSRRAVTGLLFGVASLAAAQAVQAAATPVDLIDDRPAIAKGFDIIYEARDLELPQSTRDGFTQARGSVDGTKARVKESEGRIDSELEPVIQKAYWTEAREQLRRQVGTLRFDLNALAETKPKAEKKAALELKKTFLAKVEELDFALREKDKEAALKGLGATKVALDSVLAAVL